MVEAKDENSPKRFGFKISAVTPKFLGSIIKIYEETAGKTSNTERFAKQLDFETEDLLNDIEEKKFSERRFGSSLNSHSKFQIRGTRTGDLYYFEFNPNLDSRESGDVNMKNKAKSIVMAFNARVNEFLENSGVGNEL